MKLFKVPVTWSVCGEVLIPATDKKQFLEKLKGLYINNDALALPAEFDYIDGSFEIGDKDLTLLMNGIDEEPIKIGAKEIDDPFSNDIHYTNIPYDLYNAIKVFVKNMEFLIEMCEEATTSNPISVLSKHNITKSGYLYSYFPAFWFVALMVNKDEQRKLLKQRSFFRQYDTFSGGDGIKRGIWWHRHQNQDEVQVALNIIKEYIPYLFPMPIKYAEELIKMKMTTRLKKYITANYITFWDDK